jgi:hypothetical protein
VEIATTHIEWALKAGISSWVVSWWGEDHYALQHFQEGMLMSPKMNQLKFCMLYESYKLEPVGTDWYNGSLEDTFLNDLKVIRDAFFEHPSYLKVNGRPVVIIYITRTFFQWQTGFEGHEVLKRVREKLGYDVFFTADEPFFDSYHDSPEDNLNAIVDGKQVFDAYTTYNMYVDSKVRQGETATEYQLREAMPIYER